MAVSAIMSNNTCFAVGDEILAISFSDICHHLTLSQLKDKKKKYEPPIPTRVGKRKKKTKGPDAASKLPLGKELQRHRHVKTCFYLSGGLFLFELYFIRSLEL